MIENENRRKELFELMDDNSVAIIFSGVSKISSGDEYYPFKVDTSFFYLTNIKQEHSMLILIKTLSERKTYLFVDEFDETKEKWTGKRLTFDEASELSSIGNIHSSKTFDSFLELILKEENNQYGVIKNVYTNNDVELKLTDGLYSNIFFNNLKDKYPNYNFVDVIDLFTILRSKKSSYEVDSIKRAIEVTGSGISYLLTNLKANMREYELADLFEFYGRRNSRLELAFPSIVASGNNATCLHYPSQNDVIKFSDLILFDIGFKYNGYSGDISRTFPVSGKFSPLQRNIYEAVLAANKAVINYARAGLLIEDLQARCKEVLKEECVKRGLLKEDDDLFKVYYHNVSHHLGLDTHDLGDRKKPLIEGNVITVEPGLYFAEYGIGVRIEDDILITENGCEVLSKNIVKEIDDIEKIFQTRG